MKSIFHSQFLMGSLFASVVAVAACAAFFGGRWSQSPTTADNAFPMLPIDASATSGEEFSMATGPVGTDADGIFVLDHGSGLLQCNVIYPRFRQFGGAFSCNVKEALGGGGKNSKYLMVVGAANFPGASNVGGLGNCIVYVLDQSTGAYAGFAVPFNRSMVNNGASQMGALIPIARGQARVALDRDALR